MNNKNKKIRIAINGFGRIGRLLFRKLCGDPRFDIVAINDLSDIENLAYLLKYDSIYGIYNHKIEVKNNGKKNYFTVNGDKVLVLKEKKVLKLPWKELKIDVVVEATGAFTAFGKAEVHLKAGAKKVVITAPAKDEERADARTVLMGVNEEQLKTCKISSNGSCTTNATHPVIAILSEAIGVEKAMLTTIHGYTASQSLIDGITKSKDFRRGRAAAVNIIPSTTGASISVTRALPELKGKFDGVALRAPIVIGSIVDLVLVTKKKTTVEEVNEVLRKASKTLRWKKVMTVNNDPIVSSDIVGMPYGAIVDLNYTRVVGDDLVKILSWYDNEWGYIQTLTQHIEKTAESL